MAALGRIGYPRAGALSGADFDWLLEGPEEAPFVRWFCGAAGERLVVREAELRAFAGLRERGRPVLEGAALDEALGARPDPRPAGPDDDLEALERELRALRAEKSLKLGRRRLQQLLASGAGRRALRLREREEEAAAALKRSRGVAGAAKARAGRELAALADLVARLTSFFGSSDLGPGSGAPVWMSRFSLERFLSLEERSTAALAAYTRERLSPGAREGVAGAGGDQRPLPGSPTPLRRHGPDGLEEKRLEMARLQLADVCVRHQFISLRTRNVGLKARTKWLAENLRSLTDQVNPTAR